MQIGKNEPGERRASLGDDGVLKSCHNVFLTTPYDCIWAWRTAEARAGNSYTLYL
jgi:hypothetical protein